MGTNSLTPEQLAQLNAAPAIADQPIPTPTYQPTEVADDHDYVDAYQNLMKQRQKDYNAAQDAQQRAREQAPREGGIDFNTPVGNAAATIAGAGNAASLGSLDELGAGIATAVDHTGSGMINAFAGTPLGFLLPEKVREDAVMDMYNISDTYMDNLEELSAASDELQRQNPNFFMGGQFIGGLTGGAGGAKLVGSALRSTPKGGRLVSATDSILGRLATATVVGGVEGGTYAAFEDEDIAAGTQLGATFGFGAQALIGEFMAAGVRHFSGKPTARDENVALAALRRSIISANPHLENNLPKLNENIKEVLDGLGDTATLADASQAFRRAGLDIMAHPRYGPEASMPFTSLITERMANRPERFENFLHRLLNADTPDTHVANRALRKERNEQSAQNMRTVLNEGNLAGINYSFDDVTQLLEAGRLDVEGLTSSTRNSVIDNLQKHMLRDLRDEDGVRLFAPDTANPQLTDAMVERGIAPLSPQQMLSLRHQLDGALSDGRKLDAPSAARHDANTLNTLREAMTEQLDNVLGFADVNRSYVSARADEEAFSFGYDLGTPTRNGEPNNGALAQEFIENMGDSPVLESLMSGTKARLVDVLREADTEEGSEKLTKMLGPTGRLRGALTAVYGEETSDMLIMAARRERDLRAVEDMINSATQKGPQHETRGMSGFFDLGTVAVGAMTDKVSNIAALGAGRRLSHNVGTGQRVDRAATNMLAAQGQEGVNIMDNMLADRLAPPAADPYDLLGKAIAPAVVSAQSTAE